MAKVETKKPKKVLFMDEMRYGLISNFRRSWSKVGKRTVLPSQMEYKNLYLFSAICPETGENFNQNGFSSMNKISVKSFLEQLKKKFKDYHLVVIWDNAPSHRATDIKELEDFTFINLPPYSPELNPVERFFGELRKVTANRIFNSLEEQKELLTDHLHKCEHDGEKIRSITYYPWLRKSS